MGDQPNTTNKLVNGLLVGGAGGAATQVLAWFIKVKWGIDMPAEIQMAMASLLTGVPALLAAHWTPIGEPKNVASTG